VSEPRRPESGQPAAAPQVDLALPALGAKWSWGAGLLAATFLAMKALGGEPWSWLSHAFVLLLALEFLIRGRGSAEPPTSTKLLRGALARGVCGGLLCLGLVEFSIWATSREFFPAFRPGFVQGFAALTGLGWGAVWLLEALLRRREPSASRDLLGGVIGGGVASLLTAYATVQTLHVGVLLEGDLSASKPLDLVRELASGRDDLAMFMALSVPIALTTLGRLRQLSLPPLLGLTILGTSALSGLLLSRAFVSYPKRFAAALLAASLLSLLLPLLWHLIDRFRLPGAETRAADAAMDEVIRIDRLRRGE
jgi:hypothetical protein